MCCAFKKSIINIIVAENVKRFCSKSRNTEVDATGVLMLIKAPSRNRAVYRLRGPFLGTFLPAPTSAAELGGQEKRYKTYLLQECN